jgi:hypothetical protein
VVDEESKRKRLFSWILVIQDKKVKTEDSYSHQEKLPQLTNVPFNDLIYLFLL